MTDMSTPIGFSIGNALEAREAIEVLTGSGPDDTRELTLALGAQMLLAARRTASAASARALLERALSNGAGAERLARMIAAHGGDARVVEDPARLPRTRHRLPIASARSGYVTAIEARSLGELAVALGAGRTRVDQPIDPRVGIELCVRRGDAVERGQPLGYVHLSRASDGPRFAAAALRSFRIDDKRPRAVRRVLTTL
jgi:pyrimidine-nucleoside phosphorylase